MIPKNFIEYQKELEEKYKILKVLNTSKLKEELYNKKIEFQNLFMEAILKKIDKVETKQEIEKIVYDFRYYLHIPFTKDKDIEESELYRKIVEVSAKIIEKANELKYIDKVSDDEMTNFEILRNILKTKIIKIEDSYLKLIKEKDKYFLQIFDENIFEDKIEIAKPEKLLIKPNKKISVF